MFVRRWGKFIRDLNSNYLYCSRSVDREIVAKKFSASSKFDRPFPSNEKGEGEGERYDGRASVTKASKNHARVNQSPVVCILRSVGPKARGPSCSPRCPSGLESRPGGRWQQNLSEFLPGTGPCQCKWLVRAKMEQDTARQGNSPSLSLPPHLGLHLLYEPCMKHDDGNDAWRRYWAGPKYLLHSRSGPVRACVCISVRVLGYRWDQGPSDHAISGWTVGRCFKYWIGIIETWPSRYYICSAWACFVTNFTYVDTINWKRALLISYHFVSFFERCVVCYKRHAWCCNRK